jgi:hypothetical protein
VKTRRKSWSLAEVPAAERAWPPKCDRCKETLTEPGAIALSPPVPYPEGHCLCAKRHLCVACWSEFIDWMRRR